MNKNKHSLPLHSKTLIIMGTHPSGFKTFDWKRKNCEVWMFNEAAHAKNEKGKPLFKKVDAIFQLHHPAIWENPKNRNDDDHFKWLASGETPTVYMQDKYEKVPKSVKYPLTETLSLTKNIEVISNGVKKQFKYFSSSPDYALALIAKMWKEGKKYKNVEIHGIELEMESEYQYQRTGFGFWLGYLSALGANIKLYNTIFDFPIYGYEGDVALSSDQLQKRINDLTQELGQDKEIYNQKSKNFLGSFGRLLRQDVSIEIQDELNSLTKDSDAAGILNGKIKEATRYFEKAKIMEEASGASVFSVGEFDGARIDYNKQYVEVKTEAINLNSIINIHLKKLLNLKKGSGKRQKAIDEFGNLIAELMNKNMLLLHIIGAIRENQYYIDSSKQSYLKAGGKQ